MFELTIESNFLHEQFLFDAKNFLAPIVSEFGGVIVSECNGDRASIALAVPDNYRYEIKTYALNAVADIIVSIYKKDYLNDVIVDGYISPQTRSALVAALAEFDRDADMDIVKKCLVFSDYVLVDSVYYFKMGELRARWDEIAGLVSSNLPQLSVGDAVEDMMKFMIKTIPSKTEEVFLSVLGNDKIAIITNSAQNALKHVFDRSAGEIEEKLISCLISLAPRKIVVPYVLQKTLPFMSKIENLFEGRICVI